MPVHLPCVSRAIDPPPDCPLATLRANKRMMKILPTWPTNSTSTFRAANLSHYQSLDLEACVLLHRFPIHAKLCVILLSVFDSRLMPRATTSCRGFSPTPRFLSHESQDTSQRRLLLVDLSQNQFRWIHKGLLQWGLMSLEGVMKMWCPKFGKSEGGVMRRLQRVLRMQAM